MKASIITRIKFLLSKRNLDINAYNLEEMSMIELKRLYLRLSTKKGSGSSGKKGSGSKIGKLNIGRKYVVVARKTTSGPIPPIKFKLV